MRSHLTNSLTRPAIAHIGRSLLLGAIVVMTLGACTSQGAREAEMAAQAAAQAAQEQEAARVAQEQQRQLAAERQRQREAEAAEQDRLQAQRERQAEDARRRADAERQQREAAERREQVRLAAIAAAEAERRQKLARISQLEAQIASLQASATNNENATVYLTEAVQVAEELLDALTAEQAKYENTDSAGNPLDPLAKELIADLEARKNDLVQRAAAQ